MTKIRFSFFFFDLDHTYEEFYGKGKKNKIIHIPKNSFWSPGMKLTREGKMSFRCFCTNPVSFRREIKEGSLCKHAVIIMLSRIALT